MAVEVFDITPEDGWVAITDAGVDYIRIRSNTMKHGFYITSGAAPPAATDPGYRIDCETGDFYMDVPTAELFYARTVPSLPGKTTISVFSLAITP